MNLSNQYGVDPLGQPILSVEFVMHGQTQDLSAQSDSKSEPSYEQRYVEPEKADGGWEDPGAREAHEVFQATNEGVNFRTVSWQRATVLFLKIQFAMSILAVPSSLGALGAVGGSLSLVGWQALNTCMCLVTRPIVPVILYLCTLRVVHCVNDASFQILPLY